jgi:hypothetical protein
MSDELLDCLGRRRSPAATSAFHAGRTPRNKGLSYPADPPPVEEIVAVMRAGRVAGAVARPGSHGTVLALFAHGSSGRRVINPAAGRCVDLDLSP